MSVVSAVGSALCESVDTLSMAYLDDELAPEERRELDLHMLECAACRQHVDTEREELAIVRKALAVPPPPDLVRARVMRALDVEDVTSGRDLRKRRLARWLLPGTAMVAAASALAVFVMVRPPTAMQSSTMAHEALRQQTRALPLEVQGVGTAPWLRQHFAPTVTLPQFTDSVQLVGARLTAVNGHDAAQLSYEITIGTGTIGLSAVVVRDLRTDDLGGGQEVQIGALTLHVIDIDGVPAVTYVDENRTGYVFMSGQLSAREVVRLVVSSSLIDRAGAVRPR